MSSLHEDGFRVPRPRRRPDGKGWVAEGWTAWERVAGEHRTWDADWSSALGVAVRLHSALRTAARPAHQDRRRDVFAVADRMAWDEAPLPTRGPLAEALRQLARHRVDLPGAAQVVHGDLAGNLLWHEHLPPAVIDLSPFWRPQGLGAAQLVTDATLWYGADRSLADALLEHEPTSGRQLVVHALIFRLAVDAQLEADGPREVRWDRSHVEWDLQHAKPLATWATGETLW
jgi:uncharacterized protein (TIGR02569 family)